MLRRIDHCHAPERALLALTIALAASVGAWAQAPEDSPIRAALEKAEASVQKLVAVPAAQRTFDNTLGALDDLLCELENDTSFTAFMAYVSTDAAERARGQRAEEDFNNWLIGLMKRDDLYNAVKAYAATQPRLEGEQKTIYEDALREFRRAGMELPPERREELKQLQMQINKLGIEFEKNIREDETRVPCTLAELAGVPKDVLDAQPRSGDLLLLGMDYPSYVPVQEFCTNETTRQKTWVLYKRRGGKKNVELLEQILKLRAQAAKMLGYPNAAAYETEVRMARNPAAVQAFYDELKPIVRKKAQKDLDEFTAAKREQTGDPAAVLQPWDFAFFEKYLLRTRYQVDSGKVREYFPMQSVVDGLFSITQSLYGLEYRDVTAQASTLGPKLWHEDVKMYQVVDKASGQILGAFYLDLYPRENKYNHAAQWGLRQHKVWSDGTVQRPVAALVCNFPKPTPDKPSLLPHDDVETFFHEFGHCLHTILSETRYYTVGGTNVARDFVEAPSQMFENWVWDKAVLQTFAKHYQTGEPIPDGLVDAMIRARHLGSGLYAEHQMYYGMVDMAYHTAPDGAVDTTKVANDMFTQVELYPAVPEVYFQASFGHLVGYQAGYYGYLWSLVYASDMFQRFRELGIMNPEAGLYYRKKILSRGSSVEEMELVRDYLGREPNMQAFLKHLGLEE